MSVSVPPDFADNHSLHIFVEEANGDYYTDFASELKQLSSPFLEGTVTIDGTAVFGQTLTAVTTGIISLDPGTLSYQWKRNGTTNIGTNSSTYILTADDIGKTITVTVSAANYLGSLTSVATGTVSNTTIEPEIVSVKTDGNGTITEISYTTDQSAVIIVAFYSGGKLVNMVTKPVTASGTVENITIPQDKNVDKIKIMMWEGVDTMYPLFPALTVDKDKTGGTWPAVTPN